MANPYEDFVRGKTAENILAQYYTADSNLSSYLQVSAQIRSNQELIEALKQASLDSGTTARKIVWLTRALVGAAILQAVATGWGYLTWWMTHVSSLGR
jgi:hypothetical protein